MDRTVTPHELTAMCNQMLGRIRLPASEIEAIRVIDGVRHNLTLLEGVLRPREEEPGEGEEAEEETEG